MRGLIYEQNGSFEAIVDALHSIVMESIDKVLQGSRRQSTAG